MIPSDRTEVDILRADRGAFEQALIGLHSKVIGSSATCPWHPDKNPSASILGPPWRVYCHVCDKYGDIFDLQELAGASGFKEQINRSTTTTPEAQRFSSVDDLIATLRGVQAIYKYEVRGGAKPVLVIARLVRADGSKTFRQAHHDGKGWIMKAGLKPWPIYNQPVIADVPAVVIVEGEKKVEALRELGIPATTSPCGAGKAAHADWSMLKGKRVCIWPDNDEVGRAHAADVQAIMRDIGAAEILMVEPTRLAMEMPEAGDVVDFIGLLGNVPSELKRAAVCEALRGARTSSATRELAESIELERTTPVVHLPWSTLGNFTRALLPGAVTLIVGHPGSGKSFFALSMLLGVHRNGHKVALLELEETKTFWLRRLLAVIAGCTDMMDPTWAKEHPETMRAALVKHNDEIENIGAGLWTNQTASHADVYDWIESRCIAGARVLLVDPVSVADPGKEKLFDADRVLMLKAKLIAGKYGASVIFTTHPKAGLTNRMPSQDSIAGGQAYPRLSSTILWITSQEAKEQRVKTLAHGIVQCSVNRQIHLLKARNGKGERAVLGFQFDPNTFGWSEQGVMAEDKTSRRAQVTQPDSRPSRFERMTSKPQTGEDRFT